MVVGNGMIANAMKKIDNQSTVLFCSGVSNSSEVLEDEFNKEISLLQQYYNTDKTFVYFSSYFLNFLQFDTKAYYQHKKNIENLIKINMKQYIILRLGKVVGVSSNKNTLTNYIYNAIVSGNKLTVYENTKRNLIDIDDVVDVLKELLDNKTYYNKTYNIINSNNYMIGDVVSEFESMLSTKANKVYIKSDENDFDILLSDEILDIYNKLNLNFDSNYITNLIKKYYK